MKRYLAYLAVVALVLLAWFMTSNANAGVLVGNSENCVFWGHQMRKLVQLRDEQKMPWAEVEELMRESVAQAMGVPESIVQDKMDADHIMADVFALWNDPRLAGKNDREVFIWTVQRCMGGWKSSKDKTV